MKIIDMAEYGEAYNILWAAVKALEYVRNTMRAGGSYDTLQSMDIEDVSIIDVKDACKFISSLQRASNTEDDIHIKLN